MISFSGGLGDGNLKLSQFARYSPGGSLLYHSLYGNLCFLDAELREAVGNLGDEIGRQELAERIGPEAADLFVNQYFLVSDPEEERQEIAAWLDERRKQLPTGYYVEALQLSTSNLCNFACSYCFADSSDKRSALRTKISAEQPTLTFETAKQAMDSLFELRRSHGFSEIAVKFLGREPLINWRVIRQMLEHPWPGKVHWSITTNGSLLTDEIARELAKHDVFVTVSIDGPPMTHNALRIVKTSSGPSFDAAYRGLRNLSTYKGRFAISSVLSAKTHFESYLPFLEEISDLGAREAELTLVMQTQQELAQSHSSGRNEMINFLMELAVLARRKGLLLHGDWIDPFHRLLTTKKMRGDFEVSRNYPDPCSAASHQLSLESSGDLFPCRAMSLHYGHIDDLSSALESPGYESVGMRTYYNVPFCHGCNLEGFCQGTCLGSCEESSGDIYQPAGEYCDVYRQCTDRLLAQYEQRWGDQ